MARTLFGTDGIRGEANVYPMTADVAMRLGRALAWLVKNGKLGHKQHAAMTAATSTLLPIVSLGCWIVTLCIRRPTPLLSLFCKRLRAGQTSLVCMNAAPMPCWLYPQHSPSPPSSICSCVPPN